MRVLVTGGAGFIGSHLCEALVEEGHSLTILDDLNDFYDPREKLANIEAVRLKGEFRFLQGDICRAEALQNAFDISEPEVVVHLAARAGVRPSLADPLLYEQVNVRGTLMVLEAARKRKTGKFILASSSSVYGVSDRVPFSEEDASLLPASPYAATKLAAEKLCYTYSHLYGLSAICLRFFTVFGPRQRPDLAIRKFAEAMMAHQTIPVFGDGSSARDYTFVQDTVAGIQAALRIDKPFEIYNLGNSNPISLHELIACLEEVLGVKAMMRQFPDQPGDVPITFANIRKAGADLGYAPTTPLREGLREMVTWLKTVRPYQGTR